MDKLIFVSCSYAACFSFHWYLQIWVCLSHWLGFRFAGHIPFSPSVSPSGPKDFLPCLHFPARQLNLSLEFSIADLSATVHRKFLFSHSLISPSVRAPALHPSFHLRPDLCFLLCVLRQVQSGCLTFFLPTQESSSFPSWGSAIRRANRCTLMVASSSRTQGVWWNVREIVRSPFIWYWLSRSRLWLLLPPNCISDVFPCA
jgi:hypothetical protein